MQTHLWKNSLIFLLVSADLWQQNWHIANNRKGRRNVAFMKVTLWHKEIICISLQKKKSILAGFKYISQKFCYPKPISGRILPPSQTCKAGKSVFAGEKMRGKNLHDHGRELPNLYGRGIMDLAEKSV